MQIEGSNAYTFSELPEHWHEERIYDIAELHTSNVDKKSAEGETPIKLCNYVDVYYNDRITSEIDFMEATATEAQIERFALRPGDVVITKDSESADDIGIPAVVAEGIPELVCGYHLTVIRPNELKVVGSYLRYALASRLSTHQFYLAANGVTRFGLTYQGTKNIRVALPSVVEQQEIAAFLDWKTAQIDALIAKKKALIEKLKEKRLAVITRAVTKGLDETVPMKDSGVDWLGDVPKHWNVIRLRLLSSSIEQGWSPQCYNHPAGIDEWGVMKVGCVNGSVFNEDDNKALPEDLDPRIEYKINPGDILISRANTKELLGSATLVPHNIKSKLLLCDKLYRVVIDDSKIDPEYLVFSLRSKSARFQYEQEATGASGSMQNIGQDTIKNLYVLAPCLNEQKAIIIELRVILDKIDNMLEIGNKVIEKLQQYRIALITAAVTGKIDVRGCK